MVSPIFNTLASDCASELIVLIVGRVASIPGHPSAVLEVYDTEVSPATFSNLKLIGIGSESKTSPSPAPTVYVKL